MKTVDLRKGEKMRLFNTIAIETSSKCNRHCYFCPNDYFNRPDALMSDNLILKILRELNYLKYKGRVELYIYNEPTRDKRLKEIIGMVRKFLPSACIMINTNGDYFKKWEDIADLFHAGLNQMQINIYSNADRYTDGRFDKGVEQAEERHKRMEEYLVHVARNIRYFDKKHSLYQNIGPHKTVARVVKKYGIKKESTSKDLEGENHLSNRSGNIPEFHSALKEPLKKYCVRPFRFLNINWNGDSMLCCNDFKGETSFGNVKEMSLEQIWNNKLLNEYRLRLQNNNRNMFLCDVCDFNGGFYPHMVDKVTFGRISDKAILGIPFIGKENFNVTKTRKETTERKG